MYCSKCGTENLEEARYCRNCSNSFIKEELKKKHNKTWLYLIITLILLSLVALLIFNSSNNKRNQERENMIKVENELRIKNLQDSIKLVQKEVANQNAMHDSLQIVQKPKMNSEPQMQEKLNVPEKKTQNTGYFTDERDGKKYKWVKIGDQVWMAENLAYKPKVKGGWVVYDNNSEFVVTYGYLYNFKTAKKYVIPGWHLPSTEEWWNLIKYLGNEEGEQLYNKMKLGGESGFNALMAGHYCHPKFYGIGITANIWTSDSPELYLWIRSEKKYAGIAENGTEEDYFSVRLIRD